MYADVICDLKIYVSEIKYQKYQQYIILKEMAVLECENAKIFQARSLAYS